MTAVSAEAALDAPRAGRPRPERRYLPVAQGLIGAAALFGVYTAIVTGVAELRLDGFPEPVEASWELRSSRSAGY